jgi:predicted dehydrogenase
MNEHPHRRDLLKIALLTGTGLGVAGGELPKALRAGVVGTGARGMVLVENLLRLEGVEVAALCDTSENNLARAQKLVTDCGRQKPEGYSRGATDYQRLCERNDLDLVIASTPWQFHAPVCAAAMKAGKHAATVAPLGVTAEECWQLVETAESTGRQCSLLESQCYDRTALMLLNMFRGGLLGEPLFAEAGYCHDLRAAQFAGESWMLGHTARRNGNLFPTHPVASTAWWLDITRGDRFSFLVSMSTKSHSMREFAAAKFGASDRRAQAPIALGDVNTTLVRTEAGRYLSLYYDTSTPRPQEGLMRVQGSQGCYYAQMDKIFVDGRSNRNEGPNWLHNPEFEDMRPYRAEYEHRLWKTQGEKAGSAGAEYMAVYRLVKNLRENRPLDVDVYDAATWSVIAPLTEKSVAGRNRSVDVPDFTRGKWKSRPPIDSDAIV